MGAGDGGAMPLTCQATTKAGNPCTNRPMTGGRFCAFHDADARRRAAVIGGQQKSNVNRARKELRQFAITPDETEAYLGLVMDRVIAGRMEPAIANAAANVARALVAVREAGVLEARMAAIEERLEGMAEPAQGLRRIA